MRPLMKNNHGRAALSPQKSRRGVAIETAMLFLVVVAALSTLLVSVTLLQIGKADRLDETLERRMTLEQIGNDFCRARNAYTLPEDLAQEYDIREITETRLVIYPKGESEPVLTVELEEINEKYTVTKWSYGE